MGWHNTLGDGSGLGFDDGHLAAMSLTDFGANRPAMHERSRVLGEYLGGVLAAFKHESRPEPMVIPAPTTTDVKARRFYSALPATRTPLLASA